MTAIAHTSLTARQNRLKQAVVGVRPIRAVCVATTLSEGQSWLESYNACLASAAATKRLTPIMTTMMKH